MRTTWMHGLFAATLFVAGFALSGCGNQGTVPAQTESANANVQAVAGTGHNHGGWWCPEHGVPEEICAQCNSKLAAEFQKSGDWCSEHNRPDSQCFICHPDLEGKFAARYEAKYGEEPPKPAGEQGDHEGHDHDEPAHDS